MNPERWRQIEQLYHAAQAWEPARRAELLQAACQGDKELRKEVESLLATDQETCTVLDHAIWERGRATPLPPGTELGSYRIESVLGEGGMGVVYRALDTKLNRPVAVKLLSGQVADQSARRRFQREAQMASSLNHPHIVTVYDVGEFKGRQYLVTEYLDGGTLRQWVKPARSWRQTAELLTGVADGLATAHAANILHRDIKPENILLTKSGYAKLADFGLAKLAEASLASSAETASTRPGAVLGTPAYMSPEQAAGSTLDARSDIFSFGVMLYEVLSGARPFAGTTDVDLLHAIVHADPAPLNGEVPLELRMLVEKALEKDPADRYQTMRDLVVDLKRLVRRSASQPVLAAMPAAGSGGQRRRVWVAAATTIVLAAGGVWYGWRPRPGALTKVNLFSMQAGRKWGPSFSPDGQQVAFVWDGEKQENDDIYVQLVDEATPRRLTTDPAFDYSPVWSPDALRIAFLRERPDGTEVMVIAAAGGTERRLHVSKARCKFGIKEMARQFCGLAWSPDGKHLAMVDRDSPQAPQSIFLMNIETLERHKLTTPPSGWFGDGMSMFSPGGRALAFVRTRGPYMSDLFLLPLSETGEPRGEPRRLTDDNSFIFGVDWTADGRAVVFSSMRGGSSALWRVGTPGGEPERLTVGSESSTWPSVSRKGGRLVYTQWLSDFNIWKVPAPGAGVTASAAEPVVLTHSPRLDFQPAVSPDGTKVVYSSLHSGEFQMWICDMDGSHPNRLTNLQPPGGGNAQWSPDGRQFAFSVTKGKLPQHIYAIGADGGAARQLTSGDFGEGRPSWSRDGKWVYFISNRGGGSAVWKVPSGGGSIVQVAQNGWGPALESFDGSFLYYTGAGASIWKIPVAGGAAVLVRKIGRRAMWTLSAIGVYVLDSDAAGGPTIECFPFAAGKRSEVLRIGGEPESYHVAVDSFAASPDGRWILYAHRDREEGGLMMVEHFR